MLKAIAITALVAGVGGASLGAIGMAKWDARALTEMTTRRDEAVRAYAAEQRVRQTVQEMCEAGNAAASDAATMGEAMRGAIERARQEADDAAANGDDGLGRLLDRLRGGEAAAPGGGRAGDPARGGDALPRRP